MAEFGLHLRADGRLIPGDFEAVARARVRAVKVLTTASPENVADLRARFPGLFVVSRLFADFAGRAPSPADFWSWVADDVARQYAQGVRHFEIHNEPNLTAEGMGRAWQNGADFARWWLGVAALARARFAGLQLGFPGLSPNGFPHPDRYDDRAFLAEARAAVEASDWLGVHAYFRNGVEQVAALEAIPAHPRGRPVYVTEFSNPAPEVPKATKAHQYVDFVAQLGSRAAYAFAYVSSASAPAFASEAWVGEGGEVYPIADIVGARAQGPTPAPVLIPLPVIVNGGGGGSTPAPVVTPTPSGPGPLTGSDLRGIDVSVYQKVIDWAKVEAAGIHFAYIRATLGTVGVDVNFRANWAGSERPGIIRGVYHVLTQVGTARAQWDHIERTLGRNMGELPLAVDVEPNAKAPGYNAAQYAATLREFLALAEERTGKRPIIYTANWIWNYPGAELGRLCPWAANYPLWVAGYGLSVITPKPWTAWTIWQHTDKGQVPGIPTGVDLNRWGGSLEDFARFAGILQPVPVEPPPVVIPDPPAPTPEPEPVPVTPPAPPIPAWTHVITADALNVRADSWARLGPEPRITLQLAKGSRVVVLERDEGPNGTWGRIAGGWVKLKPGYVDPLQ